MCDTIVIVRNDRVLFAKNSDRPVNEAQFLDWRSRREYPRGRTVRCTWIEIPQVERTYAVLLSRPFWMWGAEIGTNEHGLVIGNEAVFTKQPYEKTGFLGMDLLRLGLERAETAEEGCAVITSLLKQYGQGGNCFFDRSFTYHNSFLLADPRAAYVLETAGRETAIEKINGVRTISNGLTIPGFAEKHSDRLKTRVSSCRLRQARTQTLAEQSESVGELFKILRDHGDGVSWPIYSRINGAMRGPCMHAGGLAAASQTTASWVAELSPDGCGHWVTATAAPCVSVFKPVRINEPLDLGPIPGPQTDGRSLWWRHERFHRRALQAPEELGGLFRSERDEMETRWLADPPMPGDAFDEADRRLRRWTAQVSASDAQDTRPGFVRRVWRRYDRSAGLR